MFDWCLGVLCFKYIMNCLLNSSNYKKISYLFEYWWIFKLFILCCKNVIMSVYNFGKNYVFIYVFINCFFFDVRR